MSFIFTDPPIVLEEEWFVEVKKGDVAKLPCEIAGKPNPIAKWLKNGHELTEDRFNISADNTLRLIPFF